MARLLTILAIRARLTALALGVLAATGFRPLMLWPLTLIALAALAALLHRAGTWRQAALLGWCFGVGHFTVGNFWIATAFTYQANMPAWLGMIAVVLLALYLAVFPAFATVAAHLLARGSRAALALALAGSWIVAEWLRSWVFTGFAWNPLAAVTVGSYAHPGLAGIAPWLGTYALSGLVVLLAALGWLAAERRKPLLAILPALPFLLPLGGDATPGTRAFTLVQPDTRQDDLNDPAKFEDQFVRTAKLTLPRTSGAQRLVLWPESGVPDYLLPGYPQRYYDVTTFAGDPALARARIGRVIGQGSLLLTGTVDLEMRGENVAGARNAVTAIGADGAIGGSYFKAHLVPYGEYLPLRWLLEPLGLSRLVPGDIDFWPGPGPRTLDLGAWGKAGVQVCYEIVFSGQVVDRTHRPDFIFNPSNDGWFGTSGPPQHLAQARLRAIEEGLPVLRATTTGISAVIDANGAVRTYLPMHLAGRIEGRIPPAHAPTLFARLGNALPLGWAAALLVLGLVVSRRRAR